MQQITVISSENKTKNILRNLTKLPVFSLTAKITIAVGHEDLSFVRYISCFRELPHHVQYSRRCAVRRLVLDLFSKF